jgi:hypothetical protein
VTETAPSTEAPRARRRSQSAKFHRQSGLATRGSANWCGGLTTLAIGPGVLTGPSRRPPTPWRWRDAPHGGIAAKASHLRLGCHVAPPADVPVRLWPILGERRLYDRLRRHAVQIVCETPAGLYSVFTTS